MKKTLQEVREYINEGVYDPGIFKAFFLAGDLVQVKHL